MRHLICLSLLQKSQFSSMNTFPSWFVQMWCKVLNLGSQQQKSTLENLVQHFNLTSDPEN